MGKSVGWDCRTGDRILFRYTERTRRSATIINSWPHGVRVRMKNGRELLLSYRELRERAAVYQFKREGVYP